MRIKGKKIQIPMIWMAVILLYIASVIKTPATLSWIQIRNLMKVAPFLGVAAVGHTFTVLTGGTDLSISWTVTATILICCRVMNFGQGSIIAAISIAVSLGIALGIVKGLVITKLRIPPMITSLAVNYVIMGSSLILTGGATTGRVTKSFQVLTDNYIFGIPISFAIFVFVVLILWIIQTKTKFGYEIYATGANKRAAYVNGVSPDLTVIKSYVICSLCAVLTGFLLAAYIQIPSFEIGEPYGTNSLAATVIGGTLMTGGVGGVSGTFGGAIFMTLLVSFLNTFKVPPSIQLIVRGSIILIGIWLSSAHATEVAGNIKFRISQFRKRSLENTGS